MIVQIRQFFRPFREFVKTKITGGIILLFCVVLSLVLMNSKYTEAFHHLFNIPFGVQIANLNFTRDFHFWINDGLMTVFFLLVGLEIKRELLEGELSDLKKSTLPIFAAIGGMIVPAIFYSILNINSIGAPGWGIPMATDIAFALAILSLLGKRIPLSIKIFLTALAIIDDLGAIIVIAIFYTKQLEAAYLFYASIVLIALYLLNLARVKSISLYIPFGLLLWYFIYKSGIHATIAGVLFAFMIPTNKGQKISPLEQLEHALNKPVSYFIMPLFALSNINIVFDSETLSVFQNRIGLGIILGLVLGKVIGIISFSYISIKTKLSALPTGSNWRQMFGVAFLGGIGFTMSIFISLLSFSDLELQQTSKVAILFASIIAGVIGYLILNTSNEVDNKDLEKADLNN